jgi:zinc/manganese transport system permease protein
MNGELWNDLVHSREWWRGIVVILALGLSNGLLGCVLVMRRLSLIGDALSHAMLPGVGIAWLIFGTSVTALLAGGLLAGLVTALLSGVISRITRLKEDSAFAALFIFMFAGGLILVEASSGSEELLHLLFGNLSAIGRADVIFAITVSSITMLTFALFYRSILLESFDPIFHRASGGPSTLIHLGLLGLVVLNLVASLRAVGTILAVGMFILPAVTASLWCRRWHAVLLTGALICAIGSLGGFIFASAFGVAPGPSIVCGLGALFVVSLIASPVHGLCARIFPPKHHHREQSDDWCEVNEAPR